MTTCIFSVVTAPRNEQPLAREVDGQGQVRAPDAPPLQPPQEPNLPAAPDRDRRSSSSARASDREDRESPWPPEASAPAHSAPGCRACCARGPGHSVGATSARQGWHHRQARKVTYWNGRSPVTPPRRRRRRHATDIDVVHASRASRSPVRLPQDRSPRRSSPPGPAPPPLAAVADPLDSRRTPPWRRAVPRRRDAPEAASPPVGARRAGPSFPGASRLRSQRPTRHASPRFPLGLHVGSTTGSPRGASDRPIRPRISMFGMTQWPPMTPGSTSREGRTQLPRRTTTTSS